jgi:hypothetical protein
MTRPHWSVTLARTNACVGAVEWALTQPSLKAAWANCERGDWMLWLAARLSRRGTLARKSVVRAACGCALLVLDRFEKAHPGDIGPRKAIETALAYCDGKTTLDEVRNAADAAADDAAAATYAAAYAAARAKVLAQCADLVRQHFPRCPRF